jgi:hypothetical protein
LKLARISINPIHVRHTRDWSSSRFHYRPEFSRIGDETVCDGAYTVLDVHVLQARRAHYNIGGHNGYWGHSICYYLAPGEDAKFPHIPQGWRMTQDVHKDQVVPVLSIDDDWLQAEIVRVLSTIPNDSGEDTVVYTEISHDELLTAAQCIGGTNIRTYDFLVAHFDISNPKDCDVEVDGQLLWYIDWVALIYDTRYPWLEPREVGYTHMQVNSRFTCVISDIYEKWCANSNRELHKEKLDNNLRASAVNTARAALAATQGHVKGDKGAEHRYSKRRLVLEDRNNTPFPVEHAYDNRQVSGCAGRLLAFRTFPDGRYGRRAEDVLNSGDHVLIHRSNGYHRFLFIEHVMWRTRIAETCKVAFILPVAVSDAECTQSAPLSPQRGMDPRVTHAIQSNTYFASALQHAMHRRKYLRSKIVWDGRPDFPVCTKNFPVLLRNAPGGVILCGSNYSSVGKDAKRSGHNHHVNTLTQLFADLPPNELQFTESGVLQPVATSTMGAKRRVQLDM